MGVNVIHIFFKLASCWEFVQFLTRSWFKLRVIIQKFEFNECFMYLKRVCLVLSMMRCGYVCKWRRLVTFENACKEIKANVTWWLLVNIFLPSLFTNLLNIRFMKVKCFSIACALEKGQTVKSIFTCLRPPLGQNSSWTVSCCEKHQKTTPRDVIFP